MDKKAEILPALDLGVAFLIESLDESRNLQEQITKWTGENGYVNGYNDAVGKIKSWLWDHSPALRNSERDSLFDELGLLILPEDCAEPRNSLHVYPHGF